MRRLTRVWGVGVFVLVQCACSQTQAPPAAKLWTLFDVEALYASGASGDHAIAEDELPYGIPIGQIASGPTPGATLAPNEAWSGGRGVYFLTTEVWANYAEVWTQPAYLAVTPASNGSLQPLGGLFAPIFSVGPENGFYSPFRELFYAEVPANTPVGSLTSSRQILDGGYPLTSFGGRLMPLAPAGLSLPSGPPIDTTATVGTGWCDGSPIQFFDFGSSLFTWDQATDLLASANIYMLTFLGADGNVRATPSIPTVLGAGPAGSGLAPPDGGQRISSFYQVVTVQVPAGARVFAPSQASDLVSGLQHAGLDPGSYTAAIMGASTAAIAPYYGRVALNPGDPSLGMAGCFDDPSTLANDPANPMTCTWLDSEAAIEANLDLSLAEPTTVFVNLEVVDVIDSTGNEQPISLELP